MSVIRRFLISNIPRILNNAKSYESISYLRTMSSINPVTFANQKYNLQIVRFKSKGKKTQKAQVSETETEDEKDAADSFEEQLVDKQTKVMLVHVNSLRVDGLLRAGLGIARNKIETLFYESKIRVNEKKVLKKSVFANVGDVLDIIKEVNENNNNLWTVARVEILDVTEKGDNLSVKLRRCKNLIVDNYDKET